MAHGNSTLRVLQGFSFTCLLAKLAFSCVMTPIVLSATSWFRKPTSRSTSWHALIHSNGASRPEQIEKRTSRKNLGTRIAKGTSISNVATMYREPRSAPSSERPPPSPPECQSETNKARTQNSNYTAGSTRSAVVLPLRVSCE